MYRAVREKPADQIVSNLICVCAKPMNLSEQRRRREEGTKTMRPIRPFVLCNNDFVDIMKNPVFVTETRRAIVAATHMQPGTRVENVSPFLWCIPPK
jgi:hypothetical protein